MKYSGDAVKGEEQAVRLALLGPVAAHALRQCGDDSPGRS